MSWRLSIRILGVVLLAGIFYTIRWSEVAGILLALRLPCLFGYVLCYGAFLLIRSGRLQLALAKLGYELNYHNCYIATVEPAFLGVATPGRLGEFTKVGHLHGKGISTPDAISLVLVERLIDLWILSVFGLAGAVYIFLSAGSLVAAGLVVFIGILLGFLLVKKWNYLLRVCSPSMTGNHWLNTQPWTERWRVLSGALERVSNRCGSLLLSIGLFCVGLSFCQILFLAGAFGFEVDPLIVLFAYATSTLIAIIPISVGGLGTREASYLLIMQQAGIGKEQAVAFSLIDGVIFGVGIPFCLVLLAWCWGLVRRS